MIRLESCCSYCCLNYTACSNSASGFTWIHVRTFPEQAAFSVHETFTNTDTREGKTFLVISDLFVPS